MSHIKTAVFPVAGLGTRFLPITKAVPKELLPLVDRPLIDYAVEEARAAGIERFVFVSSPEKAALEKYFREDAQLEASLLAARKTAALAEVRATVLADALSVVYQDKPLGLGHAVLQAAKIVGDAPFAVILADDFIASNTPCLQQMINAHAETGGNMIATMDVGRANIGAYGCLDIVTQDGRKLRAKGMVEKPLPEEAPSTQAVIGRYILQPSVMRRLASTGKGAGGEIQLTDAIAADVAEVPLWGYAFEGRRYDCGSKAGFVEATLAVAASRLDVSCALHGEGFAAGASRQAA